jgi:hypothetical protein
MLLLLPGLDVATTLFSLLESLVSKTEASSTLD